MANRIQDVDLGSSITGATITINLPGGQQLEGRILEIQECALTNMDDLDEPRFRLDVAIRSPFATKRDYRPATYIAAQASLEEQGSKMRDLGNLLTRLVEDGDVPRRDAMLLLRKVRQGELTMDQGMRVALMSTDAITDDNGRPWTVPKQKPPPVDSATARRFNALDLDD